MTGTHNCYKGEIDNVQQWNIFLNYNISEQNNVIDLKTKVDNNSENLDENFPQCQGTPYNLTDGIGA